MTKLIEKTQSKAENYWILFFRIPGLFLFFLPFIPVTMGYINSNVDKVRLDGGDWQLLGLGFFLVWGSSYFGILGNKLGMFLSSKFGLNNKE
ncbi:hypothetical protein Phi13:2_gp088 [Cellulophaga phage phi13:2]|uniref:Uncharacterized protein n=4 Tax=Pachyviridae TaxID=2946166 RepID=S0A1D2_9CAUD|nr:hypothetical protein Phi19:3_gp091 [Cellulophaga phage phi19:3]YP_008241127.1 hypothetical protein Phi46:3_gp084 [Cellulophaga phage phi46:3]YP_008241281.1 hypothetical protein Phi18:3_gp088 [Cellulophaga phage phi18:3]YP_008242113.1 hypothetical protein Phi13:2_gp088 [Cellulophaga phage phi13:2]AGO47495.1 hypothetical protein Phi19:3_gp091 [Cellulophaga phage phi19:3]AGO48600.1 hypothetical protein Phi18:3_gp088 [Cellulophaga phage phi18:3]AGO48828.1 hypothetical protein Phi46:3_gp084 [Ce